MNIKALVVAVVTALSSLGASAVVFSLYQTQDAIGISSSTTADTSETGTSAMLLVGLMMMGTIARRRNKKDAR